MDRLSLFAWELHVERWKFPIWFKFGKTHACKNKKLSLNIYIIIKRTFKNFANPFLKGHTSEGEHKIYSYAYAGYGTKKKDVQVFISTLDIKAMATLLKTYG